MIPLSPYLQDPQSTGVLLEGELPTSPDVGLSINRRQTLELLPEGLIGNFLETRGGNSITADEAKAKYEAAGFTPRPEHLVDTTDALTDFRIKQQKKQERQDALLARLEKSTALSTRMLAESFALQFISPINIASGLLSFGTLPAAAAMSARGAGLARSFAVAGRRTAIRNATAGYGAKALTGATEGFLGNALIEAGTYPAANYLNYDYDMNDSLLNLAMGAPFGAVLHVAPKALGDARRKLFDTRAARIVKAQDKNIEAIRSEMFPENAVNTVYSEDDIARLDTHRDEFRAMAAESGLDISSYVDPLEAMDVVAGAASRMTQGETRDKLFGKIERIQRDLEEMRVNQAKDYSGSIGEAKNLKKWASQAESRKAAQAAEAPAESIGFTLPKDLQKSNPRYGYRDGNYIVNFPSDLERALYTVADPKKKSKADDKFRAALRAAGYDDETMLAQGKKVRDSIKTAAAQAHKKGMRDGSLAIPAIEGRKVDLLGSVQKRAAPDMTPKPIKAWLKKKGGVLQGSPAHQELLDLNVSTKGLVSKKGKISSLDNIPESEFNAEFASQNVTSTNDGTYVDIDWLRKQIDAEERGVPFLTQKQRDQLATQESRERVRDALYNEKGIEISSASVDDIAKALHELKYGHMADIVREGEATAEKIYQTSTETRAAALQIGTAKILDGDMTHSETVLRTDSLYGEAPPTRLELEALAKRYINEGDFDNYERMQEKLAVMDEGESVEIALRSAEMFSRGANGKGGSTVGVLVSDVRNSFGKHTATLLDAGRIKVVKSLADLPKRAEAYPDDVRGMKADDGTVYIVADSITPSEVRGLVLHEVGVHVGMRDMIGDERMDAILREVMESNDPQIRQARQAVPKDTRPEYVAEETLAYLVQNAGDAGIIRTIINHIKEWLYRTFGTKFQIDEHSARHLALGALKRESMLGEAKSADAMFSRADGDQTVIPGAEKISDKQLAERKMAQPLKAKKPQKEMDAGLFAEPDRQTTLFSRGKPEKPQEDLGKILQAEMQVFDRPLKLAKEYPKIFERALQFIDDENAMRDSIGADSKGAFTAQDVTSIIAELKDQHLRIGNQLRRVRKAVKDENVIQNLPDDMSAAAKAVAESIEQKILQNKRMAQLNFVAREKMMARARAFGTKFIDEGLISLATGSSMARSGARDSAAARQQAYIREWVGATEAALKKEGLDDVFQKGLLDKQIATALERLDDKIPDLANVNPDAVKIAKIMRTIAEHTRLTQNSLGANIPYLRNFIVHQSHDQLKIYNAGAEEWIAYAKRAFDLRAMNNPTDETLKIIYDELSTGVFERELPTAEASNDYSKGVNVGKRVSQSRTIVFKKGAWYDYNLKYGSDTVAGAFMKGLNRAGDVSGVMRMLGTNPRANMERVIDRLLEELPAKDKARLKEKKNKILNNVSVVDGTVNIPGNITMAKIGSNIRLINMMAKLGSSVFSSIADVTTYASNVRYEGRGNMFTGIAEAVGGFIPRSDSDMEILKAIDATFDHFSADTIQQLTRNGTVTHNIAAMARIYTKWNLQRSWTTRLQKTSAIGFASYLGRLSGKSFGELDENMQRVFKVHNIDESKWNIMRLAAKEAEDGRVYLATDSIEELSDDVFAAYVKKRGIEVSENSIKRARDTLANDYRAMIIDRVEGAVLTSDKRVQAAMLQGTQRGTPLGEFVRLIGQFKSYPATFIERVLKREVYGRDYDSLVDYFQNGKADMLGMVTLVLSMTATGYLSLTIKDLIAAKGPRPLDEPGTWARAMQQGGALGLYGDFLLTEYDRHKGKGLASMIMGPTIGTVGDIAELTTALINNDKTAIKATRLFMSNTPGANLFYIKPILDNLFMYNLMETMNPGYIGRMERNLKKETGQEWLLPPTQTLRR